jgi:hypothetical protein
MKSTNFCVKNLIGKIVLKNLVELISKKQHQKCLIMKEKKYLAIVVISKRNNLSSIRKFLLLSCRYFGAAKDLPGVRELFDQERKKISIA